MYQMSDVNSFPSCYLLRKKIFFVFKYVCMYIYIHTCFIEGDLSRLFFFKNIFGKLSNELLDSDDFA